MELPKYIQDKIKQQNEACYKAAKLEAEKTVVDFGINFNSSYGGYFIKYSDGSTSNVTKEQVIEKLNRVVTLSNVTNQKK